MESGRAEIYYALVTQRLQILLNSVAYPRHTQVPKRYDMILVEAGQLIVLVRDNY